MMRIALLLSCLLLCQQLFAESAPRLGPDEKVYRYHDRSYGFALNLPLDFRLNNEQGDLLFFQSSARQGTIVVRPRPGLTLGTVQQALRTGLQNKYISLIPTGMPTTLALRNAQGLAMEVQGELQGREIHGVLAGIFDDQGRGYMLLIGSVKERWLKLKPSAMHVLNTLVVTDIEPGFEYERWEQRLLGKRLIVLQTRGAIYLEGGYLSEYHFCSDRTFHAKQAFSDTQHYGVARSEYHTGSSQAGTWQVRYDGGVPRIVLNRKNGQRDLLALGVTDGYLSLNGVPYQQVVNRLCP